MLRTAIGLGSSKGPSMHFRSPSTADIASTATTAKSTRSQFQNNVQAVVDNQYKPTDFCNNLLPVIGSVDTFPAYGEISESVRSRKKTIHLSVEEGSNKWKILDFAISQQNDKVIQALIKKHMDASNAQSRVSETAPNTAKSTKTLERQYADHAQLLRCAFAQYSDEAIPMLITLCAEALNLRNVHDTKENAQNTTQPNDASIKQYWENLALLRRLLPKKSPDNIDIQSLMKACAYTLNSQGGVIKNVQTPAEPEDAPIERYSKNLLLLHLAILQQNEKAIQALIKICVCEFNEQNDASENTQNLAKFMGSPEEQYEKHLNLLSYAVSQNAYEMLPFLIESSTDKYKRTLLHYTAADGLPNLVKILLNSGVERALPDVNQMTPLHHAAQNGRLKVVEALLEREAEFVLHGIIHKKKEVDSLSLDKKTPLFLAAESGHFKVVKFLRAKGANIHLAARNGETPYSIAHKLGHEKIADFLKDEMEKKQQKWEAIKPKSQGLLGYVQSCYTYLQGWGAYLYKS